MRRVLNLIYHLTPIYRLSKLYKLEKKHFLQGILKIADEVLDEQKRLNVRLLSQSSDFYDDGHSKRPKNYINTILAAADRLSEEEMKDEINTIVAAVSHEKKSDFL